MNSRIFSALTAGALVFLLSGCSGVLPEGFRLENPFVIPPPVADSVPAEKEETPLPPVIAAFENRQKECLVRAMYFESNRSSAEGMLAVGTVVMNRVESEKFSNSICGVVGAPRQFAPGILSRPMLERAPVALASSVADRILAGERHPGVGPAMFFHQAGLSFPYRNMQYVLEAGGNAFYIKTSRH